MLFDIWLLSFKNMRLLNTLTGRLVEFADNEIPTYAVLSHRWQAPELNFQALSLFSLSSETSTIPSAQQHSYNKLVNCSRQAVKDGWDWVWVDTCCIDKSSSAELSESINSMWRW